jgi:hypothetical protein
MLLKEAASDHLMTTAFIVFGVFWIVVLLVLFVGVNALASHRDKLLKQRHDAEHKHH